MAETLAEGSFLVVVCEYYAPLLGVGVESMVWPGGCVQHPVGS
jgi:hypothetical protein